MSSSLPLCLVEIAIAYCGDFGTRPSFTESGEVIYPYPHLDLQVEEENSAGITLEDDTSAPSILSTTSASSSTVVMSPASAAEEEQTGESLREVGESSSMKPLPALPSEEVNCFTVWW